MFRLQLLPAVAITLVAAGMGLLTGCSGSDQVTYNDADVTFASEMVAHHEQAVAMVGLVEGRGLDPAFVSFADSIRATQTPEIKEMTGWLDDWDKPAPAAAALDGMEMGGDMAGMVSEDEMTRLAHTPDDAFEAQWLQLMIKHHEGAIAMAQDEVTNGEHPATVALARTIESTQTAEITRMRAMLAAI